jgi:hypothetical protein
MLPGGPGTDDNPGACIVEDVEFRIGKPFLEFAGLSALAIKSFDRSENSFSSFLSWTTTKAHG